MRDGRTRWLHRLAALFVLTLGASNAGAQPTASPRENAKDWSLTLAPYAWFAGARAKTKLGALDASAADFVKMVDTALMMRAEATWRMFALSTDYMYIKLSDRESLRGNELALDLRQHRLEMVASYRLYPRQGAPHAARRISVYADSGATYANLNTRFRFYDASDATRNRELANREGWWDWILGAHAHIRVTRVVGFSLVSSIGGFGIANSSRYTLKVEALVKLRLWRMLWADAGYRVITTDSPEVAGGKIARVTFSGVLLGLGVILP